MSTQVNAEEVEPTRSEKFLAVVLAAFLLIGAGWFYVNLGDWTRTEVQTTVAEQALFDARHAAAREQSQAQRKVRRARQELELAREAYNTALQDGEGVAGRRAEYRTEQTEFAAAEAALEEAQALAAEARREAAPAERAYQDRAHSADVRSAWILAGIRLGFIVLWLVASYFLMQSLRRRGSRYLPLGMGVAGVGALLALWYAVDYITDYVDPLDLGPIVLSLLGAAATLVAFVGLQRYLARRIPGRRVRKGECPFCGYPVRGEGPHCEGCGREVVAGCAVCAKPRRVGSAHCLACGAS